MNNWVLTMSFASFVPFYSPGGSLPVEGDVYGNFFECKIRLTMGNFGEFIFNCAEAAYQAASKARTAAEIKYFSDCKNGHDAWQYGQVLAKSYGSRRSDTVEIMTVIVKAKFDQNAHCKSFLMASRGKYLVEHTARDNFWGNGGNGSGRNELGKILMKLRGTYGGTAEVRPPAEYISWLTPAPRAPPSYGAAGAAMTSLGPRPAETKEQKLCRLALTARCVVCGQSPVFLIQNGSEMVLSNFCSFGCHDKHRGSAAAYGINCKICKFKKVYVDPRTGPTLYCSRTCRDFGK